MSNDTSENKPRRSLYLVVEGLPEAQRPVVPPGDTGVEVLTLSESNAREALEKIFAADAVSVWGEVKS
jgi:hypothetical protein